MPYTIKQYCIYILYFFCLVMLKMPDRHEWKVNAVFINSAWVIV